MFIQRILYRQHIAFSDNYRWPNFTHPLGLHVPNPVDASLALYIAHIMLVSQHCPFVKVCHATTNLKLRSYKHTDRAVDFVSVIEASKLVPYRGPESVSYSISAIEVPASCRLCTHYIYDLLPYDGTCTTTTTQLLGIIWSNVS
jgi:hypothetical protein